MIHTKLKSNLLLLLFCTLCFWGNAQSPDADESQSWRHKVSSNPLAYFLSYANLAYDYRISDRHAVGVEAMYAQRFVWILPSYEESIWDGDSWDYGEAFRLRFRHKLFLQKIRAHGIHLRFELGLRHVRFREISLGYRGPSGETESTFANIQRSSVMAGVGMGQDMAFGNFNFGWFLTVFGGMQQNMAEKPDGSPLPTWVDVDINRFVGGPRLGLSLGYSWGKNSSARKGGFK